MSAIVILTRQPGARILAALGAAALVFVLGVIVSLGWQADAHAGGGGFDWYVSPSGSNTDDCRSWSTACHTIAQAVFSATSGDRIHIAAGSYNEQLFLSKSLSITGTHPDRGLYNGGRATLDDVTVSANTVMTYGGGIYNQSGGVLTLTNVTIKDNHVNGGPGGGVFNLGTAILSDVVISGNVASGAGGGFYTQGSASLTRVTLSGNTSSAQGGGGIVNNSGLTLVDVTLKNNTAPSGGGIWNYTSGEAHLTNVTLYSNTATADRGGGIWNQGGTAYLVNVTLSGNTAQLDGGGIHNQSGMLDVTNATVAYNQVVTTTVTKAGGIANLSGTANVENSLIAFNDNSNCSGTISSYYGRNLDSSGDNTCQVDDDLVGYDPLLGPLQNNGGATFTHALGRGSWAIDNAEDDVCPSTDQRGWHRPIDGDRNGFATCDIGAFEFTLSVYLPLVLRN